MKPFIVSLFLLLIAVTVVAQEKAPAQEISLNNYIELMRADLRTSKMELITKVMKFSEEESKVFWPIYREYDAEMVKLGDKRVQLIKDLIDKFDAMTDKDATDTASRTFALEKERTALKEKYFKKICKVLPAKRAAQFFQVENQLNLLIDLQISANLPIIQ